MHQACGTDYTHLRLTWSEQYMVAQVSGECKKKQDIKQGGGRRQTDRQTLYSKTQNLCKVRTWRGAQMSTQVQAASAPIISEKSGTELHNLPGTVLPSLNGLSVQSSSGVREAYYSCFCFLGGSHHTALLCFLPLSLYQLKPHQLSQTPLHLGLWALLLPTLL